MASTDTKAVILDTAENLFAEHGYGDVSLREIIAAAQFNLAAVHYHFGSKEALFQEILSRRIAPLNKERLRLLDALEEKAFASGHPLSLNKILEALFAPALRLSRDRDGGGEVFMKLMGRTFNEPNDALQQMLLAQFRHVADRFIPAIRKVLPKMPVREFFWRFHFTIGAMAHTMANTHHLKFIAGDACDPNDTEGILKRLVAYTAAGMQGIAGSSGGKG
jgi:AcrR family transcriptional regulator